MPPPHADLEENKSLILIILIIAGDVSDSGQGSELCLEDTQCLAYHFYVQDYLCGKYRTALPLITGLI